MDASTGSGRQGRRRRAPLSRERIIEAAAAVADRGGLDAVTMRSIAKELGIEAMSLYHHVGGKEAVLDALANRVFEQFALPRADADWRSEMIRRADSLRDVLTRHPWGLGMIESRRNAGSALLRHHDAVLGSLLTVFPMRLASHAFSLLDAYIYGFILTEVNLPFAPGSGGEAELAGEIAPSLDEYPHLARMASELIVQGEYSFADEFRTGLDLILDALERRLPA